MESWSNFIVSAPLVLAAHNARGSKPQMAPHLITWDCVSHSRHSRFPLLPKLVTNSCLYFCLCCSDSKAFLILVCMIEFDFKPSLTVSCLEKIAVAETDYYLSKFPSPLLPQQQISIFSLGARSHRADCEE